MNKILLVEDDPDHAELIIDELNTGNIRNEIILMKDGQEAIDYLLESDIDDNVEVELQINLVVLGINQPRVHGMEVLIYLKNNPKYRSIPVIIFSPTFNTKTISEVYKNGANDFIKEPTSFSEFKENINKMKKYLLN